MVKEHPTEPIAARATVTKQKETPRSTMPQKHQPPVIRPQPMPHGHPFGRRGEDESADARHLFGKQISIQVTRRVRYAAPIFPTFYVLPRGFRVGVQSKS
jgi:hypothetical protein